MAALSDCLECKEEHLSASEISAIQEIVRHLKEAVGSSEKALSNAEALADQCHVLHQELSECKATSVVRKRAIQLLFQEAQHIQQHQRALLRSENLLNEQRGMWRWRVIAWLIVPSTVPRYRK